MLGIPRIARGAVGRGDAGRAHAELVLVVNARDHRAGVAQPPVDTAEPLAHAELVAGSVVVATPRQREHVLDA